MGATRVNLGTAALEDPEWTKRAIARFGDAIAVGLDVRGTTLAARGWTREGGDLFVDGAIFNNFPVDVMRRTRGVGVVLGVDLVTPRNRPLALDRLPSNKLTMTQELIANMLGVRREAVTEAAGKLQAEGLIRYRRGHITVNDRAGLEARACECYRAVRTECDRLFEAQAASKCSSINCTLDTPRNSLIPRR